MAKETTGDKFTDLLKKAATGIEKLKLQLALGKADASVKYEDVKKQFNKYINSTKASFGTTTRKAVAEVRGDLEELQVQLALGKAETKDAFEVQRKNILKAMDRIERRFKAGEKTITEEILHEFEAMRVKLEVIRVHYALGKMDAKEEFEKRKHDFSAMIAKAKAKVSLKKDQYKEKRLRRHAELKESYKHLKKAFVKA